VRSQSLSDGTLRHAGRLRAKGLRALPSDVVARVQPKLLGLTVNPRPSGCKKLHGYKHCWRVRVGDYRIIYLRAMKDALVKRHAAATLPALIAGAGERAAWRCLEGSRNQSRSQMCIWLRWGSAGAGDR
jgi:hypothetical protein